MRRDSFQNGGVSLEERASGPGMWVFRYRDADGKRRKKQIGTEAKYPTKAKAEKAAFAMKADINDRMECIRFAELAALYVAEEMPARADTAAGYQACINRINEKYGRTRIDEMAQDMMGMTLWLKSLTSVDKKSDEPRPLSKKYKRNIK
jgi:hypothetical protein